ncbi:MAG: M28 family peptidase [Armatimonadetes bacterium]|nr:M28 family peptidase [Armatimonadota bacterium]
MTRDLSGERAVGHARYLAEAIGVRLTGTEAERRAADYVAAQLRAAGVPRVSIETFPCLAWGCERAALTVDGAEVPCLPVAHAGRTPEGGVEGEFLYLETGSDLDRARAPLDGRIGLMFGSFGDEPSRFRALMDSGLAALLVVDDRLPFDWNVASGFPAYWVSLGPIIPMVSVPYRCAWDLVRTGARRARLELRSWRAEAESQNVIGVLPGTDPDAGEVIITCHHDGVDGSPAAEDNGSGVGCVLELAGAFAGASPRMGLRFISCGTEEHLSEGAKHYALRHREELAQDARLVLNTDAVGCWMGENEIHVTGSPGMRAWVEERVRATGFSARYETKVSPFSDHFPFAALGVPAVWFHRRNCAGGRFYHHSALDTADVLSPGVMTATLRAQAAIVDGVLAGAETSGWRAFPPGQRQAIAECERNWCGVRFGATG